MKIKKSETKTEPYEQLQKMVGLQEIKRTIDEVIANAKIQKIKSKMGLESCKPSLHMVFTGNPGTAKTSVARLFSEILRIEGVLPLGKLVECGRTNLVDKYVGWTAKNISTIFREAEGGILFIDEAYSLVDDSNSFGDEAINTIVQEMENYRNDVIVIFAGYPDKMEAFLNKNEGLRSRIAFHVNFPDYSPEEMLEIFKLLAEQKGYKINDRILDKCKGIFESACSKKDFGNGRFARNLLEQAIMAQSNRLVHEYKGRKITCRALVTFKPEDFDVNSSKQYVKESKGSIGFAV